MSASNTYVVANVTTARTVWVESRVGATTYTRVPIAITMSASCGGTPVACATSGALLFKEDFGGNSPSDPAIKPTGIPQMSSIYTYATTSAELYERHYSINKYSLPHYFSGTPGNWYRMDDHTYSSDTTRGYLVQVEAAAEKGQFYETQINGLCTGTKLYFSAWIASLLNYSAPDKVNQIFTLEDQIGTILAQYYTGNLPDIDPTWKQYGFEFTMPNGVTSLILRILNNGNGTQGNDFVMDDIEIHLCIPPVRLNIRDTSVCRGTPVRIDIIPTPSVNISVSGNDVCTGISVTFTAIPSEGAISPLYQWVKNGVNIPGATLSTYTYAPADGDVITCKMTTICGEVTP